MGTFWVTIDKVACYVIPSTWSTVRRPFSIAELSSFLCRFEICISSSAC